MVGAYVEHLVRDTLLAGLPAVVNEFDHEEYYDDRPVEIMLHPHPLWQCGQYVGKLQLYLCPVYDWPETDKRTRVMTAIDKRVTELTEITLHDGSRWRQILKDNPITDPGAPGAVFDVSAFYERLT